MLGKLKRAGLHHTEDGMLADAFGEAARHGGDSGIAEHESDSALLADTLDAGLRQVFLLEQAFGDDPKTKRRAAGRAGQRFLELLLSEIEQAVAFLDFRDEDGIVDAAIGFEGGGDCVAQAEAGMQLAVIGGYIVAECVAGRFQPLS